MNENTIEQAASRRAEAEAALYRDDGTKRFSDEEHRERLVAIRAERSRTFDQIDAEVEQRVEADLMSMITEAGGGGVDTSWPNVPA